MSNQFKDFPRVFKFLVSLSVFSVGLLEGGFSSGAETYSPSRHRQEQDAASFWDRVAELTGHCITLDENGKGQSSCAEIQENGTTVQLVLDGVS